MFGRLPHFLPRQTFGIDGEAARILELLGYSVQWIPMLWIAVQLLAGGAGSFFRLSGKDLAEG